MPLSVSSLKREYVRAAQGPFSACDLACERAVSTLTAGTDGDGSGWAESRRSFLPTTPLRKQVDSNQSNNRNDYTYSEHRDWAGGCSRRK
jgi:hypothetical protein